MLELIKKESSAGKLFTKQLFHPGSFKRCQVPFFVEPDLEIFGHVLTPLHYSTPCTKEPLGMK